MMNTAPMFHYKNGNATVSLFNDGTRIIEYPDNEEVMVDFPMNVDVTLFEGCNLINICEYCHIHTTNSKKEGDYTLLKQRISELPHGIEIAIGCNFITEGLKDFLRWAKGRYVCNLTVNAIHIPKYYVELKELISEGVVCGIGISYRSGYMDRWSSEVANFFSSYEHTILHVIAGLDDRHEVVEFMKQHSFKKVIILGYKDLNNGEKFKQENTVAVENNIKEWMYNIPYFIKEVLVLGGVVSFDNLALEQLKVKRLFGEKEWGSFYNHEWSFYIDLSKEVMMPSSRDKTPENWASLRDMSMKDYFQFINKK